MARVPLLETDDLPEDYRYLFEDNELGVLNLFRALGNNPPVLQSYMRWGSTLWQEAGIDDRRVELVILTVASHLDAQYEWHQHAEAGLDAGLSPTELQSIHRAAFDELEEMDAVLARLAVACVDGTVDDALFNAVADRFDTWTAVGVTLLAAHYLLTARVIQAFDLKPEDGFVGWGLENA